jgi:hypothetical protein
VGLRKSMKVLTMSGAVAHDPQRYRDRTDGPECPNALGAPPAHLSAKQKAIWNELVSQVPEGMLRSPDRFLVEVVCKMMARSRDPEHIMVPTEINGLVMALGKLGLNPIDRSKVKGGEAPKKKSIYEDF